MGSPRTHAHCVCNLPTFLVHFNKLTESLSSIIEEAVGVSCACMPTCKSLLRSHSISLPNLKTYFSKLGSRGKGLSFSELSQKHSHSQGRTSLSNLHGPDREYARVADLELGRVMSMKTYVHKGREREVSEDWIYMEQAIHQCWSNA